MLRSEFQRRLLAAVEHYAELLQTDLNLWVCAQHALRRAGLPAAGVQAGPTTHPSPIMMAIVHCHHTRGASALDVMTEVEEAWEHFDATRLSTGAAA